VNVRRKTLVESIDTFTGRVIGSDEVGYGAWAGPLVVCATSAPPGWDDPRVRDSKSIDEASRELIHAKYTKEPGFHVSLVTVDVETINRVGVYPCLLNAHKQALQGVYELLEDKTHIVVVDGTLPAHDMGFDLLEGHVRAFCLPKGDMLVPECSLASVIAKHARDQIMKKLDQEFPGYRFGSNSGYGQDQECPHRKALEKLGPCPAHRIGYEPVARVLQERMRDAQISIEDAFSGFED
jgi:ribonuclease HII